VLKEPAFDASKWTVLQPNTDPQWLRKSKAPVAWETARLHIHYATALEKSHPAAAALLANVQLTTDQVSEMSYALVVEKQDAEVFAKEWLIENKSLVASWRQ
jgi:glycine betaine/proline transport system substrate-binding protein